MSIVLDLRYLRHASLAANEPRHADKIEDPDPKSIPHAVFGNAGAAGTVEDIHIAHAVALAPNSGAQEPMQAVVKRQRQEQIAANGLGTAAGLAHPAA